MRLQFQKAKTGLFVCLSCVLIINAKAFALDKKSSQAITHYIMATIYDRQGDLEQANREYKKAIGIDSNNTYLHLNLAANYLKKNEAAKAIEELNLAVKSDPGAVEPHAILATLYYLQNNSVGAEQELEIALKNASAQDPENISIYRMLGAVYLQQKKFAAAEKIYRLILNLSPQDSEAHFYLATVYYELSERDKTIQELKKALELKPDYHEVMNYLGYLYVEENKNLEEAEAMIRKALTLQPDNGAYIDSLGWLYFKKGRIPEAVKELERASVLLEDPVIYDHLGDAYFTVKDYENAKVSWQKSLKLQPNQAEVQKKLKQLAK